jgi:hypothetical protein
MGVWIDMFVAPADGRRLSFEQFQRLLTSLAEERIVCLPFAIIEGDLTVNDGDDEDEGQMCSSPLGVTMVGPRNQHREQACWQRCRGESLEELRAALHDLPFGEVDLAVHFEMLDWGNEELRQGLERHGAANADVVIYALKQPAEVVFGSAYEENGNIHSHTLMHYFTTTGKGGPYTIEDTMLQTVLADFFGPAMLVDCSWS